ncbi:MAG: hypothetical protein JSU95_10350 [Betaproteobacteria bacterium]|nr:MAG: hypothetical protein JSU95_10350 [Betaproteobacteria bacterium]
MKNRRHSLSAFLAPKAVYGGWYLRQRPREAIKTALAHVFVIAVLIYFAFVLFRIVTLIVHALLALTFGVPFEFPTVTLPLLS